MASVSPAAAARNYRDEEDPPPRRRCEIPFLYNSVTWALVIFLTTSAFAFLIWKICHPNFPNLQVSSAAISNLTLTDTTVSAECNVTLIFTNTNRHLKTIYDRMEVSLIYPAEGLALSKLYLSSFVQPKKNQTAVVTNLSFRSLFLGKLMVMAMNHDLAGGSLSLRVDVFSIVRFRNGKWITRSQFMRAYCGNLMFGYIGGREPGMISNPIGDCEVYVYS